MTGGAGRRCEEGNLVRVLLIGGTGFVGYHSVHELSDRGHEVLVLARTAPKDDLLPAGVGVVLGDVTTLGTDDLVPLLADVDAAVFAAGADDRTVPPSPAYRFFHQANVAPVVRLVDADRKAGAVRVVIVGSYFSYFERRWPELRLAERHPYIRSRIAQTEEAIAAAGDEVDVVTLELPYVFGATPGRVPLWAPLVRYVTSRAPLLYTKGGSNMVAVSHVAEAVAGAVERGVGGMSYLVGDENLRWGVFLRRLAAAAGVSRHVLTVPTPAVRVGAAAIRARHALRGRESGLDPIPYVDLQTAETFFDPALGRRQLGYGSGGLDDALERTVAACLVGADPGVRSRSGS